MLQINYLNDLINYECFSNLKHRQISIRKINMTQHIQFKN